MNVSPTHSKITYGNRSSAKSDGVDSIVVKVRLRDYDNQPIPGRGVRLIANRDDVAITQPTVTDQDGLAVGLVRTNVPGPVTISAMALPPTTSSTSSN